MGKELEIFLSDLTPEAQDRVLKFLRIKVAEELNLDVLLLFVLPKSPIKDSGDRQGS